MPDRSLSARLSLTAAVLVIAKLWRRAAAPEDLMLWLTPTDTVVGLATGSHGVWLAGRGYLHADLRIMIGAECAGFTFFLVAYLVFALLRPQGGRLAVHQLTALLLAWPLTVGANAARILTLLTLSRLGFSAHLHGLPHEAIGGAIYLTVLLLAVLFMRVRGRLNTLSLEIS